MPEQVSYLNSIDGWIGASAPHCVKRNTASRSFFSKDQPAPVRDDPFCLRQVLVGANKCQPAQTLRIKLELPRKSIKRIEAAFDLETMDFRRYNRDIDPYLAWDKPSSSTMMALRASGMTEASYDEARL